MKARALRMNDRGDIGPFHPKGEEPLPGSRILLLVHGFNNDEVEASDSYLVMRENLDALLQANGVDEGIRRNLQLQIWELYWPGYLPISRRGPSGLKRSMIESAPSAVSYSREVRKARSWVADGLTRYLARRAPLSVFYIAHSLGCRVVFEVLKRVKSQGLVQVGCDGFLLMAGAVPSDKLSDQAALGAGARSTNHRFCLHSNKDIVLTGAFPPGQLLAGERPPYLWPVAAGRSGRPTNLWKDHAATHLGHGGYWKEAVFRDNLISNQVISGALRVATPRHLPTYRPFSTSTTESLSILPQRSLPVTRLQGGNWVRLTFGE